MYPWDSSGGFRESAAVWTIQVSNPDKGKGIFLFQIVQTGSMPSLAYFLFVPDYFAGTKRPGREVDHLRHHGPRSMSLVSVAVPVPPMELLWVWAGHLYLFALLFCHQSLTALRAVGVEVFVLPGCCTGCVDAKQIGNWRLLDTPER